MTFDRRRFLKTGAIGALTFKLAGCDAELTPRAAKEQNADFLTLEPNDVAILQQLGDVLLPGASEAGFAHFIDQQISSPPEKLLSILRYLDWPPPYASFYQDGIAALNSLSMQRHQNGFDKINEDAAIALVSEISGTQPETWTGPPAPLFYFVTRSDAVDVVYGTVEGFAKLDVPYLAHLEPSSKW